REDFGPGSLPLLTACGTSGESEPPKFSEATGRHHAALRKLQLPLAELEALACALLPVLFTFFTARITGEEAFHFQLFAQLNVELKQGAGNTHLQSPSLAINPTAINVGGDIKSCRGLTDHQRLANLNPLRVRQKVFVELAAII